MRELSLNGYIDEESWFGDEITPDSLHEPVSYTHLDVYKRQGYSPPKQQTAAQKMDGCSLIPQCSGGCL